MDNHKDVIKAWVAVPVFGEWEMKDGVPTNYTVEFTRIRTMRKRSKRVLSWASFGDDDELANQIKQQQKDNDVKYAEHFCSLSSFDDFDNYHRPLTRSRKRSLRKRFAHYFVCCIGG